MNDKAPPSSNPPTRRVDIATFQPDPQHCLDMIAYYLNRFRDAGGTYGVAQMYGIRNRGVSIVIQGAHLVDNALVLDDNKEDDDGI